MPRAEPHRPEFSRPVWLTEIEGEASRFTIEADAAERSALAARFDLLSLDRLTAAVEICPGDGADLFRVSGRLAAELAQACVVTLDPVPAQVEAEFVLACTTDPDRALAWEREVDVPAEAEDPPEPIVGGAIDIGEAVAQQLALILDPYPRCRDASIEALDAEDALRQQAAPGPFAGLPELKGRG